MSATSVIQGMSHGFATKWLPPVCGTHLVIHWVAVVFDASTCVINGKEVRHMTLHNVIVSIPNIIVHT